MSIVTAHGRIYVVESPCGERWSEMYVMSEVAWWWYV